MPTETNAWDLCECCGEGGGCGPICEDGTIPASIFATFVLPGDPCECFQDGTYELFYVSGSSTPNRLVYVHPLVGSCPQCDLAVYVRDMCMLLVIECSGTDTLIFQFSVDMPATGAPHLSRWALSATETVSPVSFPNDCTGSVLEVTFDSVSLVETVSPGTPVNADCIPDEIILSL